MLIRIFGRKKYGKTKYCINILKKYVEEQKSCYFIVPEQFTFSCEKKITDEVGNKANMYTEVLSFTRLCDRVFRRFGGISGSYLDSVGKILCMSRVLKEFSSELCEYGALYKDIGFSSEAVRTVEEFSAYNVSSKDIEKILPELEIENPALMSKLKDISFLMSAYRAELKANYGTDGERLDMLCNVLEKNNFFKGSSVIIDSFYGFTPKELRIVRHMLRQADNVYITFCMRKDDTDIIFERPRDASNRILRMAEENLIKTEDKCLSEPIFDDDISFLERCYSSGMCLNIKKTEKVHYGESIKIIKCKNQVDEAKAVSAMIYTLISKGNVHFRDIAVSARNVSSYEGIIDVFFDKANIPYAFSAKEDLLTKPIISYILIAIDIVTGWKKQSFLAFLKTGLMRITAEECAILENYIRTWNIDGKKEFNTEWYMNPSGYAADFTEKDSKILQTVNAAKESVMNTLAKFGEDISVSKKCRDTAEAVYNLMLDSSYKDKIECDDDIRFWNLTIKAIDEIVKVYGNDSMSAKSFSDIFKIVISEYGVMDIPEKLDSVLIGSADLIRSETVKYMFVLGCNNEYFPMQKSEDSIFSDNERNILHNKGIDISLPVKESVYDEFFLAYNIFCDPYEKLFLLYSEKDIGGKKLKKSVLLGSVQSLFDGELEIKYPFDSEIENLTTPGSLADDMYYIGDSKFIVAAKKVLSDYDEYREVFSNAEKILNSEGKLSKKNLSEFFRGVVCSSPSRFECFSSCRFNYFNRYVLKISPEKKAELDNLQTGLISHKILENFVKELAERKTSGEMYSHDEAKARIKELLDSHFADITHSAGHDDAISKRFKYLYGRLYIILSSLAEHLVDEIKQSDFIPTDFEVNIGISEGTIKSVPIPLTDEKDEICGELRIVGQVDRADVLHKDGKSYVRIVDYKTGPKSFKKEAVAYGFNLQMLLYLYCIALSDTKKYGENIVPAGVLYIPVRKPEAKNAILSDSTCEKSGKAIASAFKGDGLLIDDREILDAMDKGITGKYIPVSVTKSNQLSAFSRVESLENMGKLLEKAAKVSGKLASLMYSGNIQTNPYKNIMSSCAMCDYSAVCRLDSRNSNIRYKMEEVE